MALFSFLHPNPLDQLLKSNSDAKNILIAWNRGLGDIPLGLVALCHRIHEFLPLAKITFFTREDLADGFTMLPNVKFYAISSWKRGEPISWDDGFRQHSLSKDGYDLLLDQVNPTRWLKWQIGKFTPRLVWNPQWDEEADKFALEGKDHIALHIQTETTQYYRYEKNWPLSAWNQMIEQLSNKYNKKVILLGLVADSAYSHPNIIDLRGKTSFYAMLSILKNRCSHLIAPDSGVLSTIYYVDATFPLHIVSLWADPKQGILRQKVASPNSQLKHMPLIGKKETVANISVDLVLKAAGIF